mmetsp:Transcript_16382/g.25565  ORF Transcript_16382/g.25565 Transcript_16382/m.25565 type:complete len:97 (+) Transcript_16382:117-407(+)
MGLIILIFEFGNFDLFMKNKMLSSLRSQRQQGAATTKVVHATTKVVHVVSVQHKVCNTGIAVNCESRGHDQKLRSPSIAFCFVAEIKTDIISRRTS